MQREQLGPQAPEGRRWPPWGWGCTSRPPPPRLCLPHTLTLWRVPGRRCGLLAAAGAVASPPPAWPSPGPSGWAWNSAQVLAALGPGPHPWSLERQWGDSSTMSGEPQSLAQQTPCAAHVPHSCKTRRPDCGAPPAPPPAPWGVEPGAWSAAQGTAVPPGGSGRRACRRRWARTT